MASQEHIAMLHDEDDDDEDDDDDDSSSSTSTSNSDDDDDDDDDDGDDSNDADSSLGSGGSSLNEETATPKRTSEAMKVSSSATAAVKLFKQEDTAPPSMPAKKRIRLGFSMVNNISKVEHTGKVNVPISAVGETKSVEKTSVTSAELPTVEAKPLPTPSLSQEPKLVMSLPLKKKFKLPPHKAIMERVSTDGTDGNVTQDDVVVKATVVESDDAGEDDAVAAVVEKPVPVKTKSLAPAETSPLVASGAKQRRQSNTGIKPHRLPPMSSPGLLVTVPPGPLREVADPGTGLATPSAVFDYTMAAAGYTTESRSKKPHRGSSIKRVIDDMFEPNVKFFLGFPRLVPEDLVPPANCGSSTNDGGSRLSDRLLKAFQPSRSQPPATASVLLSGMGVGSVAAIGNGTKLITNGSSEKRRKRKLPGFKEMVPLSLTISYPEEYIQKRLEYIDKINAREKAIVNYQEEELHLQEKKERMELSGKPVPENFTKPSTTIPEIPELPSPPRLCEIDGFDLETFEDHHPIYLPKTGEHSLVAHLDKSCFHVIEGRYFGLSSNLVADPNFVGPNAPGLAGLSLSGGTGLATANSGGGGSTGCTLLSAPSQSGASANANAKPRGKDMLRGNDLGKGKKKIAGKGKDGKVGALAKSNPKSPALIKSNGCKVSSSTPNSGKPPPKKKKANGPPVTASSADLRRIMEDGGEEAENMKTCIIRAAVYASRCGKHTRSFRAPNGKVYPDISKAFAAHGDVKPCERCRNNKQGPYHCRLRRKHKEPDHDGSESTAVLRPLFAIPMEELVIRVIKKKPTNS